MQLFILLVMEQVDKFYENIDFNKVNRQQKLKKYWNVKVQKIVRACDSIMV